MQPPHNFPEDRGAIHPWIANLLESDVAAVEVAIKMRMATEFSENQNYLLALLEDFVPCRIEFSQNVGYILCVKRSTNGSITGDISDQLYIAQPIDDEIILGRVVFFDDSCRSQMEEFFRKFAGCGEGRGLHAGRFSTHDSKASEVAYYEPEKLGDWQDARLLYEAGNGDSVFILKTGATAWHVFETNEIVPLFDSFPAFLQHYVDFRQSSDVFDSWASRRHLNRNQTK